MQHMQLRHTRIQERDVPKVKQKLVALRKQKVKSISKMKTKRNTSESEYHRKHSKEQRLEMRKAKKIKRTNDRQAEVQHTIGVTKEKPVEQHKYLQFRKTSEILSQYIHVLGSGREGFLSCSVFPDNFLCLIFFQYLSFHILSAIQFICITQLVR